jgi:cytochrome c oxidase assembly protein Cox11
MAQQMSCLILIRGYSAKYQDNVYNVIPKLSDYYQRVYHNCHSESELSDEESLTVRVRFFTSRSLPRARYGAPFRTTLTVR